MAIICVVASALIPKQGHHLPLARIPIKQFTLHLSASLEGKNGSKLELIFSSSKGKDGLEKWLHAYKLCHNSQWCGNYIITSENYF